MSNQKSNTQNLVPPQDLCRLLFETAGEAILVLQEGRIVDWNARAELILGATSADLQGRLLSELLPSTSPEGQSLEEVLQEATNAALVGEYPNLVWTLQRPDQAPVWLELSPSVVEFEDKTYTQLVIHDITKYKQADEALRQHPDVNSSWQGDTIRHNHHIHIGSAVAVDEGLIVPVIRFADQKSFSQIAAETKTLNDKAKNKKLQPQEYTGNTFTVSNLGMMGIEQFTAIINPPDSAILAVGAIKETVMVENGQFKATNVMKVTMSCDHRTVDGAVGSRFLVTLKGYLENPVTMFV